MTFVGSAEATTRLAIDGGRPVRQNPLPAWPRFGQDEAQAAAAVLLSGRANYWTGSEGRAFEAEFAEWATMPHAVALANGTVALEIALRALRIGPGDEVVVPAATFIATASAVVTVGAQPVVVDVDEDSRALTPATIAAAITPRTAAVIVVHVGGYPADGDALARLARARRLTLIEDCAQAHGARRDGRLTGTWGDVAAWSFCNDKIMTTGGEGGAVTTSDATLAQVCWELKDHGKNRTAAMQPAGTRFRWLHDRFGTNGRMTEMQAAVGRLQLAKLPGWVARRRANAEALRSALGDVAAVRLPRIPEAVEPSYYHFYARVRPELLRPGWDRDRIVAAISAEGIGCGAGGCTEIYRERAFDAVARPATPLPGAARLGRESFVLPVHPALTDRDVGDVADAVHKVFAQAADA